MITDLSLRLPPPDELAATIAGESRPDVQVWADADAITRDLFGSATTANIFVVGMAAQAGCLPIPIARLERAIELNGVAVAINLAAFGWGRTQVADPGAVDRARADATPASAPLPAPPESIGRRLDDLGLDQSATVLLGRLAVELAAWGNDDDVRRWLDVVERARRREQAVRPDASALTMTVARRLYQLTAYKDEYEVARLMLDDDAMSEARALAAAGGRLAWKLHPPMLRALGMESKISVGPWAEPAIRILARGKRLRGSRFDPFGHAEVRRVERRLAGEFVEVLDDVLARLDVDSYNRVLELADLPQVVRGYEAIKLVNVERYRSALSEARAAI